MSYNWIDFVKAYSKEHGITYKEALKAASPSYKKVSGGSLESKTQLDVLKTECENDNEVQYLVVSRFVNNTIETEVVVDNGPKFDGAGFSKEDR